jgi:hypothetical protein
VALLAQDDASAARVIERIAPQLAAAGRPEHARQLARLIAQYDFEAALEELAHAASALGVDLAAREAP